MRKRAKERRRRREEGGGRAREACGARGEEEGGGEGEREREKGVQSSISLYPQIGPLDACINPPPFVCAARSFKGGFNKRIRTDHAESVDVGMTVDLMGCWLNMLTS